MDEKIHCIFTSILTSRATFVHLTVFFFVERDSDTVEEKQNHRLQVGITGRFLKHGRATVTLQLSNLVGYIHYL